MQAYPYPRPSFTRTEWECLNGTWEFAFDDRNVGLDGEWFQPERRLDRTILVPFPYQAPLSGIGETEIHEVVWYSRDFMVPNAWLHDGDVLLHFGAVDHRCRVWVNGREVGRNVGGHVPFSFDVRPYLVDGMNRITLRVEDSQSAHQPRGKQAVSGVPKGIDYHCTTGIWQSVWLEPVPQLRINDFQVVSHLEDRENPRLEVIVFLHAPWDGLTVEVEVSHAGKVLATSRNTCATAVARHFIDLPGAPLWSPETPELLDLRLRLLQDGALLDEVGSYTGLRSIRSEGGRLFLNGEPLYLQMVLDQGYWPEGVLSAPSDDALRKDVELMKAMGFNGVRKHQKVEDPRWLYWCDRLGLLVWGEMANARDWSQEAEDLFVAEWTRAVERDRNHPCVVAWVPINESWGVPSMADEPIQVAFVERLVALTRRLDPSRPVIDNDGWEHTDVGDIAAIHDYTPSGADLAARWRYGMPERTWGKGRLAHYVHGARYRGQPIVLTEVGGFLLLPPDKSVNEMDKLYTVYDTHTSAEELEAKYEGLVEGIASLPHVCGYCYTQLTDIAPEINGLLTAGREPKIPLDRVREINAKALARRRADAENG